MPPPPSRPPVTPSSTRLPPPASKPSPQAARTPAKTFSIAPWDSAAEGQKIILYGKSGVGKTTLATLFPDPVFIGLDDGGRRIHNPKTGKPVNAIAGVDTYQDTRDAIQQSLGLVPVGGTLVIDTVTRLEALAERHVLETVKTEKGGTAANLLAYGWGGGYRHLLDHIRLVLSDLDPLIRGGRNVVLLAQLAQATLSNSEGSDYSEDGPKLYHSKTVSLRTEVCEWADSVLRIGYADTRVEKENIQARAGKIVGDATRAIFSGGALWYVAKCRPINGKKLPPIVSFEHEQDDSLVQMLFNGAIP